MSKISIVVITYNQEKTIAQTIDSILAQQGNYELELIVSDDCSQDGTLGICQKYAKEYPSQIRLLLQERNQGITKNFIDAIRQVTGDFIAICAGDDYWIDEHKLEKQLIFLEEHPEYGVVSTNGYRLLVKKNRMVPGLPPKEPIENGEVFDKTWRGGVYCMPLTMMFRSSLLKYVDFDAFIERGFSCEDVPLQAILAKHTKYGYLPDYTSVYRVYRSSATYTSFKSPRYISYHEGLVSIRRYLHELYPEEVPFTENWANDYMAYRHFLKALMEWNYKDATKASQKFISQNGKEGRAKKVCSSRLLFYGFGLGKRFKLFFNKDFAI